MNNKWKNIFYGLIFTCAGTAMVLGTFFGNTWEFLAGFWMFMYVMDGLDNED